MDKYTFLFTHYVKTNSSKQNLLTNYNFLQKIIKYKIDNLSSINIDNILSGLKTTKVNIHEPSANENDSMISISSLNDMHNASMPKKSNRRKNKSDKNVISIDL